MSPEELAEKIENGSLRPRIAPTGSRERVQTAIKKLDDRDRQILTWLAEGLSEDEIVLRLWIPVKSLRRERRRLIQQLRAETKESSPA